MSIVSTPHPFFRKREERRELPRYPVRNEKIKFLIRNVERIFILRDLSMTGLGIELGEISETLLFPIGQKYKARLNLANEAFPVDLEVKRIDAGSVGLQFLQKNEALAARIEDTIDPLRIAHSLRSISVSDLSGAIREGVTHWYHGDMNSDLYVWTLSDSTVTKAILQWNAFFWEWSQQHGLRTGSVTVDFDKKHQFSFDESIQHRRVYQARKILENGPNLDYRLVGFLLKQQ